MGGDEPGAAFGELVGQADIAGVAGSDLVGKDAGAAQGHSEAAGPPPAAPRASPVTGAHRPRMVTPWWG
ncbi:hypothetical protein ACFWWC_50010 [Streptomyces sp. NPDC058642]|uniref:hypothetical protein n=1 Tax=Streptomyces sp. NPDC058642 TaxID=3346572 RepID=UPI003664C809